MIPVYDEQQIRRAIDAQRAVEAVREAFRADGQGRTTVPPPINLTVPDGEFHVKTACIAGFQYIAVKVASGFYGNVERGLPTGSGLMVVLDATTGMPAALLFDNGFLTDLRTGAAGAVAAEHLARADLETVGVIGSGIQARFQLECLRQVRPLRRVVAWSPNRERLARYCAEIADRFGVAVSAAASAEEAARAADVLVTATPARTPVVRPEWLKPGVHVTAVGSDTPGKRELDPGCLARADLVVADRRSQCVAFGECAGAEGRIAAELGEIVAGRKTGRTNPRQITIADLTGVGFQDTAIASAALEGLTGRTAGR